MKVISETGVTIVEVPLIPEEPPHAKYAPSKRKRRQACPGCIHEEAKAPPETKSEAADEGTKVHELAAEILRDWLKNGRSGKILSACPLPELFPYLKFISDLAGQDGVVEIEVSTRGLVPYHPEIWGTIDCRIRCPRIVDAEGNIVAVGHEVLHLVDLKWGIGIQVLIEEEGALNPQLETYTVASLLEAPAIQAQAHIVQPRGAEDRGLPIVRSSSIIDCQQAFDVRLPAILAEAKACDEVKPGEGLNPGPWCRDTFCPARITCVALRRQIVESQSCPFSPSPSDPYGPDDVADLLDKAELAEIWAKEVRSFAINEAQAGRVPTGFVLEQGLGNRAWKKDSTEASIISASKLKRKDATKTVILSPAQMEKAVKANEELTEEVRDKVWANITKKHVERPLTSPKLKRVGPRLQGKSAGGMKLQQSSPFDPITTKQVADAPIKTYATRTEEEEKKPPTIDVASLLG